MYYGRYCTYCLSKGTSNSGTIEQSNFDPVGNIDHLVKKMLNSFAPPMNEKFGIFKLETIQDISNQNIGTSMFRTTINQC